VVLWDELLRIVKMVEGLRDCPFCKTAEYLDVGPMDYETRAVSCERCRCRGPQISFQSICDDEGVVLDEFVDMWDEDLSFYGVMYQFMIQWAMALWNGEVEPGEPFLGAGFEEQKEAEKESTHRCRPATFYKGEWEATRKALNIVLKNPENYYDQFTSYEWSELQDSLARVFERDELNFLERKAREKDGKQ